MIALHMEREGVSFVYVCGLFFVYVVYDTHMAWVAWTI